MNGIIKRIFIIVTCILVISLAGCAAKDITDINSIEDVKDMKLRIAHSSSIDLDRQIQKISPESEILLLDSKDAINAFYGNKIDGFVDYKMTCDNLVKASKGKLKIAEGLIDTFKVAFAISKSSNIPDLDSKVNDFIESNRELINEIYDRWQVEGYDEKMHDIPKVSNPEYTLVVGTVGFVKPYCYYKDNKLTGAEIEVAYHLASYLNADIRFEDGDYNGILIGINNGKYDLLAANLFMTEERAETINFSEPYRNVDIYMVVRNDSDNKNLNLHSLDGKKAGVLTGTPHADMINAVIDNASFEYYNSFTDLALALRQNKLDFFVNNDVAFNLMRDTYPEFFALDESICTFDVGTIFPKNRDNQELINRFNEYIAGVKADGTLEKLKNYWLNINEWERLEIVKDGANGTLTLGTCTANKPFAMVVDGEYAGFEIALINDFCKKYGYGLKIEDCDFAGMLTGIANGKYDFAAAQVAYTKERAENVIYSDFYYVQNVVAIMNGNRTDITNNEGFVENVKVGFKKTFIDENRYMMILSGIWVTLVITVLGFLLAAVVGALVCAMSMCNIKGLRIFANVYSKIMQGTPIVVVLMIIYYVIFGKINISGIFVSILGFGLTTAAYLAQIYKGAIEQVDKGEIEAARSLGLSKLSTFFGIILPQAIRLMLPPLSSQLVGLMKGTSIVGYIAVMDMTKVSDIIRSSTYEALFPLLAIALIYFLISTIILLIIDRISYRLNPANKERKVKGV